MCRCCSVDLSVCTGSNVSPTMRTNNSVSLSVEVFAILSPLAGASQSGSECNRDRVKLICLREKVFVSRYLPSPVLQEWQSLMELEPSYLRVDRLQSGIP